MQDEIVVTLTGIQRSLGETDAQFAARLGVHRSAWSLVRTGKRRPGPQLLGGVRRAFPSLERQILDFVASENVAKATKVS